MKQISTLVLAFFLAVALQAQTNVTLQVNHHLSGYDFEFDMESQNNMSEKFTLERLQYYISEIVLVHDGGMETAVVDQWPLINAETVTTDIDLGSLAVTDIEKVRFAVGVDQTHNHLDPASWPAGHPLAPQFPSMHWGWTAGYRFVAMEGSSGTDLSQIFQIHALGDANYFTTEVDVTQEDASGDIIVPIYADYTRAIEDVEIASGLIVHGDYDQAITLLENFRDYVYSGVAPSSPPPSGIEPLPMQDQLAVYPVPAPAGMISVVFNAQSETNLLLTDMLGRTVSSKQLAAGADDHSIYVAEPGVYLLQIVSNGEILAAKRVVIQ